MYYYFIYHIILSHVHVDGVRLRLWTAATSRPVVYPPLIWVWRATVEWYWQGRTEKVGVKSVPVPLFPLQISHELIRAQTRVSTVPNRLNHGTALFLHHVTARRIICTDYTVNILQAAYIVWYIILCYSLVFYIMFSLYHMVIYIKRH
jgi:hypothetical protein